MVQILIVDDEEEIREMFYRHLTHLGYGVLWAENGKQASELFQKYKPPVTILDLRMPEMDGIEFLKTLSPEVLVSHGIIIMTGNDEDSDIETCFRLGVQSFMRKPVNLFELEGNIKRSLDLFRAVSEIKQLNHRLMLRQQDFPNFLWECDDRLCFTYVDDNFTQILGIPTKEVIGNPFTSILIEEDIEQFFYKFTNEERRLKSTVKGLTLRFKRAESEPLPLQVFANGQMDSKNNIMGMVGICRDMSVFDQLARETEASEREMGIRINSQYRLVRIDADIHKYLKTDIRESQNPDFIQFLEDSSMEQLFSFSFDQKEDIPFPIEIKFTGDDNKEHHFSVQLCYDKRLHCLEGHLLPLMAKDQLGIISDKMESQRKSLEEAVILDDKMKQSILKDARNLSSETLSLVKAVESFAFPAEGQFDLEEYGQFLFNRNLQVFFENLRLLSNKIHGLKGSCGFLVPQAKQLCHKIEDITRPLSEQHIVLTKDISFLLKQTIFKIQDILDQYQEQPDSEFDIDDWLNTITQSLKRAQDYVKDQQGDFSRFLNNRCTDHGEVRKRRVEEYLSVSLNGYEKLAEQTQELYYSLSDTLSDEKAIQASSLYNQFLQTHQEIKRIPLDLSRYERLIPNLAQEYSKEADLVIEDHQVKADREFWNAVHEILNHVLKNAVIHGLETPGEREALGKDPAGKVTLKLSEDALHILLTISDDGRGIDKKKIAEKALANSVVTGEQLEMMSESEILNLLFVQGVSTAESLDDNAGRGVGMNAVEEAMHQFQGTCRIETTYGKGCSYHFSFAKNNVSLPCIIVAIGDVHIAIPEDNVESFVNYRKEASFMVKQQPSYRYNGSAVPLIDHEEVFEIGSGYSGNQNQLIILKSPLGKSGLVIDDILHHAIMPILPLPRIYRKTPIYLGITIFKDTPIQVVDVEKLI